MKYVQQVLAVTVLLAVMFGCSGCATMLGGIIGYQSGELAAGMVIGAAVDFGGTFITSTGQMLADEQKEFRRAALVDSEAGTVQLPRKGFSVDRTKELVLDLQPQFQQAGWTWHRTRTDSRFCITDYNHNETWRCTDASGQPFELRIEMGWKKDSTFEVQMLPESQADRLSITLQLYAWLQESVMEAG